MEIVYCDACGFRISEQDMASGVALRTLESSLCAKCLRIGEGRRARRSSSKIPIVTRKSSASLPVLSGAQPEAPEPHPRPHSSPRLHGIAPPRRSAVTPLAVGGLVGLCIAFVLAFMIAGELRRPASGPQLLTAEKPKNTPPPATQPAGSRRTPATAAHPAPPLTPAPATPKPAAPNAGTPQPTAAPPPAVVHPETPAPPKPPKTVQPPPAAEEPPAVNPRGPYLRLQTEFHAALRNGRIRDAAALLKRGHGDPEIAKCAAELALDARLLSWAEDAEIFSKDATLLKDADEIELQLVKGEKLRVGALTKLQILEIKDGMLQLSGMAVPLEKIEFVSRLKLAALACEPDGPGCLRRAFAELLAGHKSEAQTWVDKARAMAAPAGESDYLQGLLEAIDADAAAAAAWDAIEQAAAAKSGKLPALLAAFQKNHGATRFAACRDGERQRLGIGAKANSR